MQVMHVMHGMQPLRLHGTRRRKIFCRTGWRIPTECVAEPRLRLLDNVRVCCGFS
jgi:hypothetical protein